jgi:hypothetical protein
MQSTTMRAALLAVGVLIAQTTLGDTLLFELRRGVLVDVGRETLYLPAPSGSIEAVDVSAGRLLWSSDAAALPLTVDGSLLVAQAEESRPARLPIVVLDVAASGRKVVEAVIPLPDDVRALVVDGMEQQFRASATREEGGFLISWTFTETIVQGIARPAEEPLAMRTVSGSARLDLGTGRVTSNAAGIVRTGSGPRRPIETPTMDERRESSTLRSAAQPAVVAQVQPPARWQAGNYLVLIEGGRGGALTLKRWDARTGVALPDRELLKKAIVALPSAERTYVLASERVGAGGPEDPEYRWSIFSLETGERVGELRRDVSAAPFFVWNDSVVFESRPFGYRIGEVWIDEPLKLRAVRLSRGVPIWDRAVRHLEYRGPVPPSR